MSVPPPAIEFTPPARIPAARAARSCHVSTRAILHEHGEGPGPGHRDLGDLTSPRNHFEGRWPGSVFLCGLRLGPVLDLLDDGGIGQGGGVAERPLLGYVTEQPAHDLAAAGLR